MPGIFRISLICAGLLTSAVASVAQTTAGTPYGTAKFETYKDIDEITHLIVEHARLHAWRDRPDAIPTLDVAANALNSTANFLKAHGWRAGAGYQPGEGNFAAIQAWNAASVYQRAIALMGRQIDGG